MGVSGDSGLSVEELADRAGVSVRTVRYYISQGLLPGPANRGKYASYDEDHLTRLQLIRRLVDQHVPLAELREQLGQLSSEEVRSLLRQQERRARALEHSQDAASPRDYVSGLLARARSLSAPLPSPPAPMQPHTLSGPSPARAYTKPLPLTTLQPEPVQRWELAPGVELYVRADAAQKYAQLIERLLESARNELGRESN
jgi:DNA-binding transcriptional MerR regulator